MQTGRKANLLKASSGAVRVPDAGSRAQGERLFLLPRIEACAWGERRVTVPVIPAFTRRRESRETKTARRGEPKENFAWWCAGFSSRFTIHEKIIGTVIKCSIPEMHGKKKELY